MEVGVWFDGGSVEMAAARGDASIERVQCGEMLVDDRLIDQRPEMLGGL
jgi:hypothetical protein